MSSTMMEMTTSNSISVKPPSHRLSCRAKPRHLPAAGTRLSFGAGPLGCTRGDKGTSLCPLSIYASTRCVSDVTISMGNELPILHLHSRGRLCHMDSDVAPPPSGVMAFSSL
jgi:hypothetical protein